MDRGVRRLGSRAEDSRALSGAPAADPAGLAGGGPIFDETPMLTADFAPRPLRPSGRRGPLVAMAWATGLVAVVGLGLLAGGPLPSPVTDPEARPAVSLPAFGWPVEARTARSAVSLESPARANVEVTSRRLGVRGTMLIDADHVRIALEARDGRVLEQAWVDVYDPDGGIRPARTPTFKATFDLPGSRPSGTMWVVVTAFDEGGSPLGSVRRAFTVGPLRPGGFVASSGKGLDGNWPWGPYSEPRPAAAPLPTCLPVSSTLASGC